MTAACVVCGALLESAADPILDEHREAREMGAMGKAVMEHFHAQHKDICGYVFWMGNSLSFLGVMNCCTSSDERFSQNLDSTRGQLKDYLEKMKAGERPAMPDVSTAIGKPANKVQL